MVRKIYCNKCGCYVGEIRDAKLMVGITYMCRDCSVIRQASSSMFDTDMFGDLFDDIFKGKK
jgi:late competence protein required for DNA uptake (superfamily II DNA/RNA helicase)